MILLLVLPPFFFATALAGEINPKNYRTQYAAIYYFNSEDELSDFGRKINSRALFSGRGDETTLIRDSVDRIVYRVKTILAMYPPDFQFNIYIYSTYDEIKKVYREIGMAGTAPIAFYLHKPKTIYVSLEKINDRIFAHEVAHAIINSYFDTPPPAEMQEILAQYVDKHLWDE